MGITNHAQIEQNFKTFNLKTPARKLLRTMTLSADKGCDSGIRPDFALNKITGRALICWGRRNC